MNVGETSGGRIRSLVSCTRCGAGRSHQCTYPSGRKLPPYKVHDSRAKSYLQQGLPDPRQLTLPGVVSALPEGASPRRCGQLVALRVVE